MEDLILDRYRPLETGGAGASGTVEICWDTRIQRRVAIKRMPLYAPGAMPEGGVPGLAEARTGAMLSHPNIVTVIDFETTLDEALLIMEAIEGPTLAELVDEAPAGGFDPDIAAYVAESVAAALDFAHENQVLHLDIKPENILVTSGGIVKVSDFGISELADARGFGGASGGTIGYMPPEQMRGEDLDQRCDEFALAVVVYEMLTGRSPFMAPTMEASLRLMEGSVPDAPSELRDDVPPELDGVLLAALSPDREERFETVYDFAQALDGLVGDAKAGRRKLKALVQSDGAEPAGQRRGRPGALGDLWGRIPPKATTVAGRAAAALLCFMVALLGAGSFDGLGQAERVGVALLAAAGGTALPTFGALIALCILGAGAVHSPSLPSPLGAATIVGALLWAALARKRGAADANCALAVAPLQVVGMAPLAPLLAGFCLAPGRAALASGAGALLSFSLGVVTSQGRPFLAASGALREGAAGIAIFQRDVTDPATWIIIGSWVISAVLMAVLSSRQTRVSSAVGALLGTAALLVAQALAVWTQAGTWAAPNAEALGGILAAFMCMIVISALGAPRRDEGDN